MASRGGHRLSWWGWGAPPRSGRAAGPGEGAGWGGGGRREGAVFGDRHPSVAASLANLAALNRHLGETEKARDLFDQAFAIAREVQGEEHPFTQALLKARDELGG